ncbi:prenyltransferase [Atopobacter phocae]|uniref:prenyltransferase n=1 Tax=Atopobacter phocae TaxID=136492 RepID=UPI0004703A7A|nr:prenyltransferase [Atopobacter phocae]
MKWSVLVEVIELKAKVASIFPCLLGTLFSYYYYQSIHLNLLFIFFIAMILFNTGVDVLSNYSDFHKASLDHDYKYETNVIGRENISLRKIFVFQWTIITVSACMGLYVASQTGWPLLIMGLYCYTVGIFYSSGPKPISSMPLGEIFSGFTMGFMIPLISVYINTYEKFSWSIDTISAIFVLSLVYICFIANIMLANNICDLEEDRINRRFTLVHYIGRDRAKKLFVLLIAIAYVGITMSVIMRWAPLLCLGTLFLIPFSFKKAKGFIEHPVKTETFVHSVQIFTLNAFLLTILYTIGVFI